MKIAILSFVFVVVLFTARFIEAKSISTENEDIEQAASTDRSPKNLSDEDDYGLGIIFDESELDNYGKKYSSVDESKTESPVENMETTGDGVEKLVVTSKAYLLCGEGQSDDIGC